MSYATDAELTTYATARGITITGTASELLTKANDVIESYANQFQGNRTTVDQSTAWPRVGVYVDGYLLPSDTVPQGIKNAEMQIAIEIDGGNDPLGNVGRAVKRQKVDVIETEYSDRASDRTRLTKVTALLTPYLIGIGMKRA